jgi:hypothetical protein
MEGKPQGLPFVQDFSLNSFIGDGNAEAVDGIFVILQNGVFGQDYEITKIEVVNALDPV